jgi:hypothetical protein
MQTATKRLFISAVLLGIIGGIIGLAAGVFLGFALGAALASVFHVSSFEGGAGYFAVAIALLVTVQPSVESRSGSAPGIKLIGGGLQTMRNVPTYSSMVAVSDQDR